MAGTPIFETSVRARPCNDHRFIPTQEEEQVFHFSLAYRPTSTSSSSILRTSRLSAGRKKRRGKKRRRDTLLRADVGPAGVETTTLEPRASNRIPFLGRDEDDEREENGGKGRNRRQGKSEQRLVTRKTRLWASTDTS